MNSPLRRMAYLLLILAAVVAAGTRGFMYFQDLPLFDAFYFTIVTVATVGFGDIVPTTVGSRILSIFVILSGAGVFSGIIVNFTEYLIDRRTKQSRLERMNILVELFYGELGNKMLHYFISADPGRDELWTKPDIARLKPEAELERIAGQLRSHVYKIDPARIDLDSLKVLLIDNGNLLINLLENPALIEHESFTDVLRTTYHFRQELAARADLAVLLAQDRDHLARDANKAYIVTAEQWVHSAYYLQKSYPYLFSLTMRTSPFTQEIEPEVKENVV